MVSLEVSGKALSNKSSRTMMGIYSIIENIPRVRTTGTQRNRRPRVIRARAPIYGHCQTLNMPYPSLGYWAQVSQVLFQ